MYGRKIRTYMCGPQVWRASGLPSEVNFEVQRSAFGIIELLWGPPVVAFAWSAIESVRDAIAVGLRDVFHALAFG